MDTTGCESAPNNDSTPFTANALNFKPIVDVSTESYRLSRLTPYHDSDRIEIIEEFCSRRGVIFRRL